MPVDEQSRGGDTFIRSVARAIDVIRAFSADKPRLTLAEVARRSNLGNATARRFLLTLESLGYVRSEGREFTLTPAVLELGYSYLSALRLPEVAQPHLEKLSQLTGEATSAGVLDHGDAVYIGGVPTPRIMSLAVTVGARMPAFATSLGRVLLAYLPDEELEAFLADFHAERFTSHTVVSATELRSELVRVAAQGWSLVDQELGEGIRSIAVPLWRQGKPVAAINVTSTSGMLSAERLKIDILPLVQATAKRISHEISHLPSV